MRLTIRLLGLGLLDVEISTDPAGDDYDTDRDLSGGSTTSYPIGFTPSPGDQRWEKGVELQ